MARLASPTATIIKIKPPPPFSRSPANTLAASIAATNAAVAIIIANPFDAFSVVAKTVGTATDMAIALIVAGAARGAAAQAQCIVVGTANPVRRFTTTVR